MKKKQLMSVMGVVVLTMGMVSCVNMIDGTVLISGERVTETRPHKGFEQIVIKGSPTVYYSQADSFSVKVKGPSNIVEDILTDVDGKQLIIRNRGKIGVFNFSVYDDDAVGVYVTSPDLTAINLNGSGDFIVQKQVDTDKLTIVLLGSGDIVFKDIICDDCSTELTGSGDIEIKRLDAQNSSISLIGSGDISVKQWNVRSTDVMLKGSGDISIDFVEGCRGAECQLTGSGDISLKGHLEHYSGQKRGSGDIDTDKLSVEK